MSKGDLMDRLWKSRDTSGPKSVDPNDTSTYNSNEEVEDTRPMCCEGHHDATNRAMRRFADKFCKAQK